MNEPICLPEHHRWEDTYYGYKCTKCGMFVPFGSEPWIDAEPVELDNPPGSRQREGVMSKRITVSTSKPALRLRELATKLTSEERWDLGFRLKDGARVVVFHIDGERVSLAEVEQREMVPA